MNAPQYTENQIETAESRLPSQAAAIHEKIRAEAQKELKRDALALIFSAIAAGLSIGMSLLAKAVFHNVLEESYVTGLIESVGYTFGFIIVIMARQQLFTENTLTAVLPFMQAPSAENLLLLLRLWGIVLLGNLIGTAIIALVFRYFPSFDREMQSAFLDISLALTHKNATDMFCGGILSGWIIATMVWMFPHARSAKIWVIMLMTWLVSVSDFTHIVVGSVEVFYLIFTGNLAWYSFFYPFGLATLTGNILGGTFIFALLSHAQIRSEMT